VFLGKNPPNKTKYMFLYDLQIKRVLFYCQTPALVDFKGLTSFFTPVPRRLEGKMKTPAQTTSTARINKGLKRVAGIGVLFH